MNRSLIAAAVLALGAARAAAEEPLVLTLDQAVKLGVENNIDAEAARYDLAIFESRFKEIEGTVLPEVTLTGNYTHNYQPPLAFFSGQKLVAGQPNSVQAEAMAVQPLYTGGKVLAALRAGRAERERSTLNLRQTRDDVALAVKQMFYAVLLASATASIERDNLASAEEHLRTIQERYKQGLDSDLTVLRQQVEVANAKPAAIAAANQVELGLTMLKNTLALDVDRPVSLSGELGAPASALPSYEKAGELALSRRPEVLAARQAALVEKEKITIAKADGRPSLSAFADILWQGQGPQQRFGPNERGTSSAAGLNLTFPVFRGGQVHQRASQARLQYEKSLQTEAQVRRDVRVDVKRQWLNAREALERAQSEETAIGQGRRALESVEVRYKAGQAGQLDLTDATLALNRTRTAYVRALSDYWSGLAALERAVGTELKEIMP